MKENAENKIANGPANLNDRLAQYLYKQSSMSPKEYRRDIVFYWSVGILMNVTGLIFMSLSIHHSLEMNANVSVNLVRVDGVRVQEAFDIRRDVLMKNSLKRAELNQSQSDNQ